MGGMPRLIRPMLASLRRELPHDEDRYGWEFKWDGVRAIAYVSGGPVRLLSRNGKDMTASYPELAVLAERVGRPGDPGRGDHRDRAAGARTSGCCSPACTSGSRPAS